MAKYQRKNENIGFWTMVRDVVIASMNKGQLPLFLVAIIFSFMIYKMPGEDVSKLVFMTFEKIADYSILGYLLAGGAITAWLIHVKLQRKIIAREMKRIGLEKSKLQEAMLGKRIKSSED